MNLPKFKLLLKGNVSACLLLLISSIFLESSSTSSDLLLLPTGQTIKRSKQQVAFDARPLDIALSADKKTLFVKCDYSLLIIDADNLKTLQQLKYPSEEAGSMHGIAVYNDSTIFVSGAKHLLLEAKRDSRGAWHWGRQMSLGEKDVNPCGIALSLQKHIAYVCLSIRNCVAVVDLDKSQ